MYAILVRKGNSYKFLTEYKEITKEVKVRVPADNDNGYIIETRTVGTKKFKPCRFETNDLSKLQITYQSLLKSYKPADLITVDTENMQGNITPGEPEVQQDTDDVFPPIPEYAPSINDFQIHASYVDDENIGEGLIIEYEGQEPVLDVSKNGVLFIDYTGDEPRFEIDNDGNLVLEVDE